MQTFNKTQALVQAVLLVTDESVQCVHENASTLLHAMQEMHADTLLDSTQKENVANCIVQMQQAVNALDNARFISAIFTVLNNVTLAKTH